MLTKARFVRISRGKLSASGAARAIGVNVSSYNCWERGVKYYRLPSEKVEMLAELLCVLPDEIADEKGHALAYAVA